MKLMIQGVKMNRLCPICACADKTFIYKQNFNNKVVSLTESYDVVVCGECGFTYADNIPSQPEFDNYYEIMSKYEFNDKDGVASGDYIDHYAKIVDFLTPHINKEAGILDIGCSTGGLLSVFKSKGYLNIAGIDPSPSCVKTAIELYGVEATVNNIYNFPSIKKFDLVILSAVLEHLVDFSGSMQKIRLLLKDQGLLFIEVPDAERFAEYIRAPFQQFSIEHINYFSKDSLKNLLSKFNFKVTKTRQDENRLNLAVDPDIFILSQKCQSGANEQIKDNISELKIRDYVEESSKIDLQIKEIIKNKLPDKNKVIVWGVGTHTQRLIGSGLDLSRILYFVDSNLRYAGKQIDGIAIKSPNDIREDNPILISTYSYQKEIVCQIKDRLKLKNEVITIYG